MSRTILKFGGHRDYYYLKSRHTCQCRGCRRQTSVTAGTVMHHTHLPLTIWFWAIYLCATDKRVISAKGLARQLELSYESAWYLLVRIRSAMHDRDQNYMLQGIIEMDEACLGASKHGKNVAAAQIVRKWLLPYQRMQMSILFS